MTQLPHGMVQVGQNPYPPLADRYLADRISGFSIRALPRYATKPLAEIMATTGTPAVEAEEYASGFDHDFETVTPYYTRLLLEDYDIDAAMTVSQHASFYKFRFPQSEQANILINNNRTIRIARAELHRIHRDGGQHPDGLLLRRVQQTVQLGHYLERFVEKRKGLSGGRAHRRLRFIQDIPR